MDGLTKYIKLVICFIREDILVSKQATISFFQNMFHDFGIQKSVLHDRHPRFTRDSW